MRPCIQLTPCRNMRKLVSDGCTTEVLALATGLAPDLPVEAPQLFFHLRYMSSIVALLTVVRQCEFVDYIRKRDYDSAMQIARSCLGKKTSTSYSSSLLTGPMSVEYPEFAQYVRDATVLLAFKDNPPDLPVFSKVRLWQYCQ